MSHKLLTLVLFIVALSLNACAGSQANPTTVTAAPAAVQPTATPMAPAATPAPTSVAPTPAPTSTPPATAQATPEKGCPPAEQLGPWPPSSDGTGHNIEITASRGWVHASLWWPHGQTPWGNKEVSVLLPPGTNITVLNGSGTAWDYPSECAETEVRRQLDVHVQLRRTQTAFHGVVELKELLDLGLVVRR